MSHNPNPFDFVHFGTNATTVSKQEFDSLDERWSGYLTVQLKTLTPLHIVGAQDRSGTRISSNKFYRQVGVPTIPGSSIKGMLRSFVEAITCGWLSQVNDEYLKINGRADPKNGRHIGFRLFDKYEDPLKRADRPAVSPKVNPDFKPGSIIEKMDVASWLFGFVEIDKNNPNPSAVRGKVMIEDVICTEKMLSDKQNSHHMPDIEGAPFMGGGKPSASSWWYFSPHEVRLRVAGNNRVAEFVGGTLRGRKFYYHQEPARCIAWYDANWRTMNATLNNGNIVQPSYYTYPVECLSKDTAISFRIDVRDLPTKFLALLCLCLEPGQVIRHKLGYGKAYGYGSIEMNIQGAMLRPSSACSLTEALSDKLAMVKGFTAKAWQNNHLNEIGLDTIVSRPALNKLAQILGWNSGDGIVFTYPPFNHHSNRQFTFGYPIPFAEAVKAAKQVRGIVSNGDSIAVRIKEDGKWVYKSTDLAKELFHIKHPINLMFYQTKSEGWQQIQTRLP